MTPAKAYEIASQWGSFITSGDPGAVFYSFPLNDARPQSEEHREQLAHYTFGLIKELRDDADEATLDDETRANLAELRALWDFFTTSPLATEPLPPRHLNEFELATDGAVQRPAGYTGFGVERAMNWWDLDAFTQGYIEALFFTSEDELSEEWAALAPIRGRPGCINPPGFADLAPEALASILADCAKFQATDAWQTWDLDKRTEYPDTAQDGRDFWYTRNGHGCGFWDGDYPQPYAAQLTGAAEAFGSVDAYLGDDGKVYLS